MTIVYPWHFLASLNAICRLPLQGGKSSVWKLHPARPLLVDGIRTLCHGFWVPQFLCPCPKLKIFEDVEFYIVLDTWLARFSEGPGWISFIAEHCFKSSSCSLDGFAGFGYSNTWQYPSLINTLHAVSCQMYKPIKNGKLASPHW